MLTELRCVRIVVAVLLQRGVYQSQLSANIGYLLVPTAINQSQYYHYIQNVLYRRSEPDQSTEQEETSTSTHNMGSSPTGKTFSRRAVSGRNTRGRQQFTNISLTSD